mmetsp:Transcript_76346/g.237198  ORF Transcript_76346/g.237198 Transcript_76346/m.237198 type:complete len:208 (-) Transcript_76346:158-781(-)
MRLSYFPPAPPPLPRPQGPPPPRAPPSQARRPLLCRDALGTGRAAERGRGRGGRARRALRLHRPGHEQALQQDLGRRRALALQPRQGPARVAGLPAGRLRHTLPRARRRGRPRLHSPARRELPPPHVGRLRPGRALRGLPRGRPAAALRQRHRGGRGGQRRGVQEGPRGRAGLGHARPGVLPPGAALRRGGHRARRGHVPGRRGQGA